LVLHVSLLFWSVVDADTTGRGVKMGDSVGPGDADQRYHHMCEHPSIHHLNGVVTPMRALPPLSNRIRPWRFSFQKNYFYYFYYYYIQGPE
jgi:hypothetical protein